MGGMADYATKQDVQTIVTAAVNKTVDDLSEVISQLAQSMHQELVDIKKDIAELKESHNKLIS